LLSDGVGFIYNFALLQQKNRLAGSAPHHHMRDNAQPHSYPAAIKDRYKQPESLIKKDRLFMSRILRLSCGQRWPEDEMQDDYDIFEPAP
jgi:hypothetical protein